MNQFIIGIEIDFFCQLATSNWRCFRQITGVLDGIRARAEPAIVEKMNYAVESLEQYAESIHILEGEDEVSGLGMKSSVAGGSSSVPDYDVEEISKLRRKLKKYKLQEEWKKNDNSELISRTRSQFDLANHSWDVLVEAKSLPRFRTH
jgi:hypothetical protein